jgi:hypothetical protein
MTGSRTIVLVAGGMMLVFIGLQPPPRYKRVWAAGVVFLGLSFLADVAPQVAAPASVLVLLALAYKQRGELGTLLGNVGKASAATLPAGAPTGVKGPQGTGGKTTGNTTTSGGPAGTVGPIGAP